ncbi:zinc-binding protein A33-like [Chanos chanos]|uniref:Zinc-binding protein A33-like n=1 Tax=Chanos chanos TaxID=29144 RepID=A0A6J2WRE6_CHACN|nr:zinc-binding protein A33-like [Chanos chanos]
MAFGLFRSKTQLCCLLCSESLLHPVELSCKHSFCKECLRKHWDKKKSRKCPKCKRRSSKELPAASQPKPEQLCHLHREKLKLFCLEDVEPICTMCRFSKVHSAHTFRPMDEAALDLKEEIEPKVKPLKDRLSLFLNTKLACNQMVNYIKIQAQNTERQIKEEFEKLHQFLRDEEAARIAALREEEEEKIQMMKGKMDEMRTEISSLADVIKSIQEELYADDLSFLLNYKATVQRTQYTLRDPEVVSGVLINVAEHLGNLKFRVWEKMEEIVQYTPVILDPNTSHVNLTVSEDLLGVRFCGKAQLVPDNPERFKDCLWVVGSQGFDSGSHRWEVEVGENADWAVGVTTENRRKRWGIWRGNYVNVQYGAASSESHHTLLHVKDLRKVRVKLDWDGGTVSFCDAVNEQLLHTFTHTFLEQVIPYFCVQSSGPPLRVLPTFEMRNSQQPMHSLDYTTQHCVV